MNQWALTELDRRLANLIRCGTVAELDAGNARVRVRSGEILTGWLPWVAVRAGADRSWSAPEPGEQVLLLAPSGDLGLAFVLPGIYQQDFPAPANSAEVQRAVFDDGTTVEYDRSNHVFSFSIAAGGKIRIVGDVEITGKVTVTEEVTAAGVDLTGHVHGGVIRGGADTDPPS